MSDPRIEVDAAALRQILVALNGAGHEIRELQALRNPPFDKDNPINKLTSEFNTWCSAQQEPIHA